MKRLFLLLVCVLMILIYHPIYANENNVYFTNPGVLDKTNPVNDNYPFEHESTFSLSMWKNDVVNGSFVIETDSSASVSISHNGLRNARGNEIDLEMGKVDCISASLGVGDNVSGYPHVEVKDIITHEINFVCDEDTYVWFSIKTNGKTKPGTYTDILHVNVDNITYDLKININVVNMMVEDVYSLDLWQYPYSSYYYYDVLKNHEPFDEKHLEILKEELEIYRDLGGRTITTTICDEPWSHQTYYDTPSMVNWYLYSNHTIWFDYSYFDSYVELCMELGIDEKINCFSILPFDNAIRVINEDGTTSRFVLTPGSDEWNYYWTQFMYSFVDHLDQKGWFDKTYLFVDERGIIYFDEALDLIHSIPNKEGKTIKVATAVNITPKDRDLYDQIDYLSISIASVNDKDLELLDFIEHRKQLGLETTMYNCSTNYPNAYALSNNDESIWTMWYLCHKGFDGYLRWALNAWMDGLCDSLDFENFEAGDTLLMYPGIKNDENPKPFVTPRLMMIEQGLKEISKYNYLSDDKLVSMYMNSQLDHIQRSPGNFNSYGAFLASNDQSRSITSKVAIRLEKMILNASNLYIKEKIKNNLKQVN